METVEKSKRLGMAHSVARFRLNKIILFNLLYKHKENVCYRCTRKIDTIDELSIEHKQPWFYSPDPFRMFFDLENIAFSHLKCNSSEGGKRNKRP